MSRENNMNVEHALDLCDIESEGGSDWSEENDPEIDTIKIKKQNENVLSFENNQDLVTKVWSHARIQSILVSFGVIEAILVTMLCCLQERSYDVFLSEFFPFKTDDLMRNHFLFVHENGEIFVKPVYGKSSTANKLFSVSTLPKKLLYVYEYKRKIYAIHYKNDTFYLNCQRKYFVLNYK